MADWLGNSFVFGYDVRSNLTSIRYPTSTTWTENFGPYDAANNLPTLTLTSPTYGTSAVGYTQNADENYSNQAGTAYGYNAKTQVTTGGTHTFGYSPNGEISSDASGGTSTTFSYANDAELTSKSVAGAITSYAYDANGNRCASVSGGTTPSCTTPSSSPVTTLDGYNAFDQLCYTATVTTTVSNPTCTSPPPLAATYSYNGEGLRTYGNSDGRTAILYL
jgi:YD repeat-containing protein